MDRLFSFLRRIRKQIREWVESGLGRYGCDGMGILVSGLGKNG